MFSAGANGYTAAEIRRALQGGSGSREWSFRYDLYDNASKFVGPLTDTVLSTSIEYNSLAEINRSATFNMEDNGKVDFLNNRIKPWARLTMPADDAATWADRVAALSGLLGHWKFDEAASTGTATDATGGGWNLTAGVGVLQGRTAILNDEGRSVRTVTNATKGNGSLQTASTPVWIRGQREISVAVWIRPESVGTVQGIVSWGEGTTTVSQAPLGLFLAANGALSLYNYVEGGSSNYSAASTAPNTVVAGQPYFVVATWRTGQGCRIYVNGVDRTYSQINPGWIGQTSVSSTAKLYVGEYLAATGAGMTGQVDDLFFVNRALTAEEITQLWYAGRRGADFRPGYVEFPQGLFLLSSPTRIGNPTGLVGRAVAAYDQCAVLLADKISEPLSFLAGELYTNAMLTVLGTVSGLAGYNVVKSTTAIWAGGGGLFWDSGTSKLKILNDLAAGLNYTPIYFDENGIGQLRPYQAPSQRGAEYVYDDTSVSVLYPEIEQTLDLFDQPNKWVLIVSNPDQPLLRAEFTNADPASPTSTVRRGRTIVDVRTEEKAGTQAILDAKVRAVAEASASKYEEVRFSTGFMPIHQHADVYQVNYAAMGIADKYGEVSWAFELKEGATMTHTARRVVNLKIPTP